VVAAGLAAVVLAVVLAAVATARPLGFLHLRRNLSNTATLTSAYPDLVVSPGGDQVVVVWTEGYRGDTEHKGHVYLRAASETGAGWGSKIPIFSGGDSACARAAAVGVAGTTAHVAYVVSSNTCNNPDQVYVRYQTCSLVSGQCADSEVTHVGGSSNRIIEVDLALDADGNPHVVWTQCDASGHWCEIIYSAHDGSAWSDPYPVASNENDSWENYTPAIAWADGYVHVVWVRWDGEGYEEAEKNRRIWYWRQSASGGESSECIFTPVKKEVLGKNYYFPPGHPDLAAGSGKVFVVWDCCSNCDAPDPSLYCSEYYHLVYRRSNDSGASWPTDATEVGTSYAYSPYSDQLEDYVSKIGGVLYRRRLRPSIVLNRDGWPTVAWHADCGQGGGEEEEGGSVGGSYVISYTYATMVTDTTVDWISPTLLSQVEATALGSAAIGVGESGSEPPLRHVAYMREVVGTDAWEIYYDSNESADRYKYVYLPLILRAY